MSDTSNIGAALKRPVVAVTFLAAVVVLVVWLLAFFLPQGRKLSSLNAKEASLRQAVVQDNVRLARLEKESRHTPQIESMLSGLQAYAPATAGIYTYTQTLSNAAKTAGVIVSSISPGAEVAIAGSAFSAIPVNVSAAGTYDHLLSFIKDIYVLPRLTDINTLSINGGGVHSTRATSLTVSFNLDIFTTQKPASTP